MGYKTSWKSVLIHYNYNYIAIQKLSISCNVHVLKIRNLISIIIATHTRSIVWMQFVYKCIIWMQFLIILRHIVQDGQILDIAIAYLYTFPIIFIFQAILHPNADWFCTHSKQYLSNFKIYFPPKKWSNFL